MEAGGHRAAASSTGESGFFGEDFPLVEGKIRVRFGPYETKAFLFVNDHVVFGLKRERKGGDAYEDV